MKEKSNIIDRVFAVPEDPNKPKSEAENVSLIVKEWLKPTHVRYKTRYSKGQIVAMSIFQSLADTYNITTLKRFLKEYRTAKLSEEGKSSEELRDILMNRMPKPDVSNLEKLTRYLEWMKGNM